MKCKCILILCYLMSTFCFSQTSDTSYTVSGIITNYKPGKSLYFALYASEKDFDQRNFYRKTWFRGDQLPPDTIHYRFTDVAPGEYIIAGYQDMNDDGKLNMWIFGPREPYRIYLPNYGWVPVDASRGDSESPVGQAKGIGELANRFLITTHSGGGSQYLGWGYNSEAHYKTSGYCNSKY